MEGLTIQHLHSFVLFTGKLCNNLSYIALPAQVLSMTIGDNSNHSQTTKRMGKDTRRGMREGVLKEERIHT